MYFATGDLYGTGTVWNVSLGGWRVDSEISLERGTLLKVYVMLPDFQHTVVVDQALVSWSRGHEFGLSILHIEPQDAARLKSFITARVWSHRLAYFLCSSLQRHPTAISLREH
jgi:hypothetical protein